MSELFQVKVPAISKHLKNIFETGELDELSTVFKMETVEHESGRDLVRHLDLAENNAQQGIVFSMTEWTKFLDGFLQLSNYPILKHKGKISMLEAKIKAEQQYDEFRLIQDRTYESDFDKEIKKLKGQ